MNHSKLSTFGFVRGRRQILRTENAKCKDEFGSQFFTSNDSCMRKGTKKLSPMCYDYLRVLPSTVPAFSCILGGRFLNPNRMGGSRIWSAKKIFKNDQISERWQQRKQQINTYRDFCRTIRVVFGVPRFPIKGLIFNSTNLSLTVV